MVCGNGDGRGQFRVSCWDGIQTALGEGMATREAANGQPGTPDDTETDQGNVGIFRAGREIEALGGAEGMKNRRHNGLIDAISDPNGEAGLGVVHRVRKH